MKKFLTLAAVLAASTCYGCHAHAQCPGGQCPVQQASYPTPVRQVIHGTAQAFAEVTAPKCQAEHKGILERIADKCRERREARQANRGCGCR